MEKLLNARELAALLGVSVFTIRKWVCARTIPFTKMGAACRFNPDDVERWLKAHRVEPIPKG